MRRLNETQIEEAIALGKTMPFEKLLTLGFVPDTETEAKHGITFTDTINRLVDSIPNPDITIGEFFSIDNLFSEVDSSVSGLYESKLTHAKIGEFLRLIGSVSTGSVSDVYAGNSELTVSYQTFIKEIISDILNSEYGNGASDMAQLGITKTIDSTTDLYTALMKYGYTDEVEYNEDGDTVTNENELEARHMLTIEACKERAFEEVYAGLEYSLTEGIPYCIVGFDEMIDNLETNSPEFHAMIIDHFEHNNLPLNFWTVKTKGPEALPRAGYEGAIPTDLNDCITKFMADFDRINKLNTIGTVSMGGTSTMSIPRVTTMSDIIVTLLIHAGVQLSDDKEIDTVTSSMVGYLTESLNGSYIQDPELTAKKILVAIPSIIAPLCVDNVTLRYTHRLYAAVSGAITTICDNESKED